VIVFIFSLLFDVEAKEIIKIPIAVNNLNLREEPNLKSKILCQLYIGEYVEILKIDKNIIKIDNNTGRWVYVKTFRKNDKPNGWLFDYYLAYEDRFRKVTDWSYKHISKCSGDYCPTYRFNNNGTFIVKFWQYYDKTTNDNKIKESCEKSGGKYSNDHFCHFNGQLFKYLDLIWARLEGNNQKHFLFISKSNKLCMPGAECEN
jgi:hypothetical protein